MLTSNDIGVNPCDMVVSRYLSLPYSYFTLVNWFMVDEHGKVFLQIGKCKHAQFYIYYVDYCSYTIVICVVYGTFYISVPI